MTASGRKWTAARLRSAIIASHGSAGTMAAQLEVMRAAPRHAEELIAGHRVPQSSPSVQAGVSREFRNAADRARRAARREMRSGAGGTRGDAFRKRSPSVRTDLSDVTL